MLSLKSIPNLHRPSFIARSRSKLSTTISMGPTTIEHVVLFKVKDSADPTGMLTSLRSLTSLNLSTYLTAVPVLRSPSSSPYTHLLHSRYLSKPDLASYSAHPDHLSAVRSHVLPLCDQILAVDFVSPFSLPPPPIGSAVRITLAKPKPDISPAHLVSTIADVTEGSTGSGAVQLSYGENFSPARAQGYEVGKIAVFPGVEELEKAAEETEEAKEKVRPLIDSVIILDYVVPEMEVTASL